MTLFTPCGRVCTHIHRVPCIAMRIMISPKRQRAIAEHTYLYVVPMLKAELSERRERATVRDVNVCITTKTITKFCVFAASFSFCRFTLGKLLWVWGEWYALRSQHFVVAAADAVVIIIEFQRCWYHVAMFFRCCAQAKGMVVFCWKIRQKTKIKSEKSTESL